MDKVVKVYAPNNFDNTIAEFYPPKNGETLSKEILINPLVSIEQNGNSTFTFSINKNSEKWQYINNPENIYEVDGRRYIAMGDSSFTFDEINENVTVVTLELWNELSKKYVQAYNVDPKIEHPDEHSVILLPKSKQQLIVNGSVVSYNPYLRGSIGYNAYALLIGSGWTLGTCDVMVDGFSAKDDFGVFNIETDQKDILYTLNLMRDLYGGVFIWDSINKILHIRDESKLNTDFNTWKGFEIRKGYNLKSLNIVQNNELITRLYPLGEGKLNIKAINNEKTYLENFSYTNKIYSAILENSDIYDQKQLKFWGEKKLAEFCKPRISYTVDFADLSNIPEYQTEKVDIYDIIKVVYYDELNKKNVEDFKRVISKEYNPFNLLQSSIIVGEKQINYKEIIKQAFTKTDYNSNGNIAGDNIYLREDKKTLANWKKETDTSISEINVDIGENFAKIELLTQVVNDDIQSLAQYKQEVTNTYATISSFTTFQTATTKNFTAINQRVDANSSSITLISKTQTSQGSKIASIEIRTSKNESSITLKADTVYVEGQFRAVNATIKNLNADIANINSLRLDGTVMLKVDYSGSYQTVTQVYTDLLRIGGGSGRLDCGQIECTRFLLNNRAYSPQTITDKDGNSYTVLAR